MVNETNRNVLVCDGDGKISCHLGLLSETEREGELTNWMYVTAAIPTNKVCYSLFIFLMGSCL